MRNILLTAGLLLLLPSTALAQGAPGGAAGGGGEGLLVSSQEPDLSTDARSLEEVQFKSQKLKRAQRVKQDVARPAQPSEIVAGKAVHDTTGQSIALIEKVEADGVILRAGAAVVKIPAEGFGINKKGLLLNVTKPQFDEMLASAGVTAPRS